MPCPLVPGILTLQLTSSTLRGHKKGVRQEKEMSRVFDICLLMSTIYMTLCVVCMFIAPPNATTMARPLFCN